jgi:hypothetical protein
MRSFDEMVSERTEEGVFFCEPEEGVFIGSLIEARNVQSNMDRCVLF